MNNLPKCDTDKLFNFKSIFNIIKNNTDEFILKAQAPELKIGKQPLVFYLLFQTYYDALEKSSEEKGKTFSLHTGNINETIHGERSLKKFKDFYTLIDNHQYLAEDFNTSFINAMGQNVYTAINEILELYLNGNRLCELQENYIYIASLKINSLQRTTSPLNEIEKQNICHFFAEAIYHSFDEEIPINKKPKPLDIFPSPCEPFLGRQDELNKLAKIFKSKDSTKCFLTGYSGLGKSELAKKFAKNYESKTKPIFYLPYEGNLKRSIANMTLPNETANQTEEERFQVHAEYLRTLDANALLVIDNFNVAPTEDAYFDTIMKYQCKILFTTTYAYETEYILKLKEIEDTSILLEIVKTYYQNSKNFNQYKETIIKIIEKLNKHTFAIVLASKLMKVKRITPPKLLEILTDKSPIFDTLEQFEIKKDGKTKKLTFKQHISLLFSLFNLNKEELNIMKNMCMIPLSGIDCSLFAEWTGYLENMTGINDLINMGLLNENEDGIISLHSLTREHFLHEAPPNLSDCTNLLQSLYSVCCERYDITQNHILIFSIINNILIHAEKTPTSDLAFYMQFLIDVYRNLDTYEYIDGMKLILKEMSTLLEGPFKNDDRSNAIYCLYSADHETNLNQVQLLYDQALDFCDNLPYTPETILLRSNIFSSMASAYIVKKELQMARACLENSLNLRNNTDYLLNPDGIKQWSSYYFVSALLGDIQNSMAELENLAILVKDENLYYYALIQETIGLIHICTHNQDLGIEYLSRCLKMFCKIYELDNRLINEKIKFYHRVYTEFQDFSPPTIKGSVYNLDTLEIIDD